jgi:aspartyl-tRNA(Asn)/glutamyl-tRNA(Gln) amidotransferase subunit B
MLFESKDGPEALIAANGLAVLGDEGEIDAVVRKVIDENLKSVEDYRSGKEKAFGFIMGQCMRELKGKADPAALRERLAAMLEAAKPD